MNYNIDQILEDKKDYEVLEWFAAQAEAGEDLTPVEKIPALIHHLDSAYSNGFVDLLWSDRVKLVYDGFSALEACVCTSALAATRDLQDALNRYGIPALLTTTDEPIDELEEDAREALLSEVEELEDKHNVISREFSRALLEKGYAYIIDNRESYRRN